MQNKNWDKIEEEFNEEFEVFNFFCKKQDKILNCQTIKDFFKKRFQSQHQQFEDIVKKLNSEIYEDTGITNYCQEILKELNKLK